MCPDGRLGGLFTSDHTFLCSKHFFSFQDTVLFLKPMLSTWTAGVRDVFLSASTNACQRYEPLHLANSAVFHTLLCSELLLQFPVYITLTWRMLSTWTAGMRGVFLVCVKHCWSELYAIEQIMQYFYVAVIKLVWQTTSSVFKIYWCY